MDAWTDPSTEVADTDEPARTMNVTETSPACTEEIAAPFGKVRTVTGAIPVMPLLAPASPLLEMLSRTAHPTLRTGLERRRMATSAREAPRETIPAPAYPALSCQLPAAAHMAARSAGDEQDGHDSRYPGHATDRRRFVSRTSRLLQ